MKKIRLNVDELHVESFAAAAGNGATGTVQAHASDNPTCQTLVCPCQVTQAVSDCVCPGSRPC
ncbi:MAG TPA: hypothetical protein VF771_05610 [Longimicrobiaceae bacterium]